MEERGGRGTIGMETRPEAGRFPIRRCPPRRQAKAAAGEKLTSPLQLSLLQGVTSEYFLITKQRT